MLHLYKNSTFCESHGVQPYPNTRFALQLRSDFAVEMMLQDTQRVVCRDHGSCWGGGTGRILMSVELKQVDIIHAPPDAECSTHE